MLHNQLNIFKSIRIQPTNIRDVAYQALRDAILNAQLRPGERLIEERLAQQFGVSRTPLREAIQKLELEGLVVRLPSGGVMVSRLDTAELENLYQIRINLEGLASRQAATRIVAAQVEALRKINATVHGYAEHDDLVAMLQAGRDFHRLLWTVSGNGKLVEILDGLTSHINRYRMFSVVWRVRQATAEHHAIIDALAAGLPDEAERLTRLHIQEERNLTLEKLAHTSSNQGGSEG